VVAPVLVVIGDLVEDVVVLQRGAWVHGTDNPAVVVRRRGGSAANVAAAAAEFVATRFIGRVGGDRLGTALADDLAATGAEVRVQTEGRTGSVVVIVTADGERTMYPDRAAAAELGPVEPAWLAGAAMIHVPAYTFQDAGSAAAVGDLLDTATRTGTPVSLDASAASLIHTRGRSWFLAMVERWRPRFVFANGDEAAVLGLDATDPPPGSTWVIKHGAKPAELCRDDGTRLGVPAVSVEGRVDSTGAGDAFAGAFLAAHLLARPRARRANAAVLTPPLTRVARLRPLGGAPLGRGQRRPSAMICSMPRSTHSSPMPSVTASIGVPAASSTAARMEGKRSA
jgi:sugar/nucleoside kinase (ribokinase family)